MRVSSCRVLGPEVGDAPEETVSAECLDVYKYKQSAWFSLSRCDTRFSVTACRFKCASIPIYRNWLSRIVSVRTPDPNRRQERKKSERKWPDSFGPSSCNEPARRLSLARKYRKIACRALFIVCSRSHRKRSFVRSSNSRTRRRRKHGDEKGQVLDIAGLDGPG